MRKFYKAYFKQKAIADVQIAHTEDDKAFFFIKDIYNPDAFDNAIRSLAKSPCLLLENYGTKLSDGNNRNYSKVLQGRFNIVAKADNGDSESEEEVQERCEAIAEDLLAKMREDLQEGAPIVISDTEVSNTVWFPVQQIDIDPIGPISTNYWGVSVSFMFKTPAKGQSNPTNWPATP